MLCERYFVVGSIGGRGTIIFDGEPSVTVREQIELILEGVPECPDRIAMKMRALAAQLDTTPDLLPMLFIGEWAALERRTRILENHVMDLHAEIEWLDSHLAALLPGAYGLDSDEEDDNEGW